MFLVYIFRTIFIMLVLEIWSESIENFKLLQNDNLDYLENRYGTFPESLRLEMLEKAKEMFFFGYSNYLEHAFPMDELNPIMCTGRGPDYDNPSNININDVLGDYCLTLIDALDTLAIMGNITQFQQAVALVVENVDFDKDSIVQVFEVNIRTFARGGLTDPHTTSRTIRRPIQPKPNERKSTVVQLLMKLSFAVIIDKEIIGALLSTHLLMKDEAQPFGKLAPDWYDNQLLDLAHDLAARLIPAFENSPTGLPQPRVNLRHGMPAQPMSSETCPAGAGSLLLEMGVLSRLLKDPVYEGYARRANRALWSYRARNTGLLGNAIDATSGQWIGRLSGLGAGLDSFYEYLLKSYIMFGETEDYQMFTDMYKSIHEHMRRGRPHCNKGIGDHPLFVNVDMNTGSLHTTWIDSLQAAFAGIQVLNGDIEEAVCTHALYYLIWKRFGVLPERWNWKSLAADVAFYPLRPELIESTYLLYQATKSPFYLHVGREILENLNQYTRTHCGYATVHSVTDMSLEDRMESFFLSETSKYLYLLFDKDNYINKHFDKYIFSTEGHIFPVEKRFREKMWIKDDPPLMPLSHFNISEPTCESVESYKKYLMPLKSRYLIQVGDALGITEY